MIVAGRRLFDPADTLAAFEAAVTPDTQAVICTHVSNVFGYILPLEEIAALLPRAAGAADRRRVAVGGAAAGQSGSTWRGLRLYAGT